MADSTELKPTISLPLAIWGEGYSEFLPQWFEGVYSLEAEWNEICIITDNKNYTAVAKAIPDFTKVRIRVRELTDYAHYWNAAIEMCQGKWIGWCNADDKFLPEALNEVAQADAEGANLICDHLVYKHNGQKQSAVWNPDELDHQFSLMGANPMTKSLWESCGGMPEGMRFPDWGMALRMRRTGLVKPFYATTIRIIHDLGYDRVTLSGVNAPSDLWAIGKQQCIDMARELS